MSAAIALADPSVAVIGGTWGRNDAFIDELRQQLQTSPRPLEIRTSALAVEPDMSGARAACLARLRDLIALQGTDVL